jgi:hypothetical protein
MGQFNNICLRTQVQKKRPISNLLESLRDEDPSITSVILKDGAGPKASRWARATVAEDIVGVALKNGELILDLNEGQMISSINIQSLEERLKPIHEDIATLERDIKPLQDEKQLIDTAAQRRAVRMGWFGLVALCAQCMSYPVFWRE